MSALSDGEPWHDYSRQRLQRGFAHPLQQSDLRAALLGAGLAVASASLAGAVPEWWLSSEAEVTVLYVHRHGDAEARAWGPHEPWQQLALVVNPCPSKLRPAIRQALHEQGLPKVLAWLSDVPRRGNAWGASERRLEVVWLRGALRFVEDRQHYTALTDPARFRTR